MNRLRLEWPLCHTLAHPLPPAPADHLQVGSINGERTGAPQTYGTRWLGNLSYHCWTQTWLHAPRSFRPAPYSRHIIRHHSNLHPGMSDCPLGLLDGCQMHIYDGPVVLALTLALPSCHGAS